MSRRYLLDQLRSGPALTSPGDARSFVLAQLRSLPHEVFACIWLDNQHRVLSYEPLFNGTIDGAAVYPREVVRRALSHNAAAVILAHNHPSGVAEPSDADRQITARLTESLQAIEVRVLDHLVVGAGVVVSFAERGWIGPLAPAQRFARVLESGRTFWYKTRLILSGPRIDRADRGPDGTRAGRTPGFLTEATLY